MSIGLDTHGSKKMNFMSNATLKFQIFLVDTWIKKICPNRHKLESSEIYNVLNTFSSLEIYWNKIKNSLTQ